MARKDKNKKETDITLREVISFILFIAVWWILYFYTSLLIRD